MSPMSVFKASASVAALPPIFMQMIFCSIFVDPVLLQSILTVEL
jgi:hypothetical protein